MSIRLHLLNSFVTSLGLLIYYRHYDHAIKLASAVLVTSVTWVGYQRLLQGSGQSKDVYELDHVVLNIEKPKSLWLNMGYWKDTDKFLEACEALASKLGRYASLSPSDRIVDVGHGTGASLLYYAKQFSPAAITGVTSVKAHTDYARQSIQDAEDLPMNTAIDLETADAVKWTADKATQGKGEWNKVLALDCAYHFSSRTTFLRNTFSLLPPGGTLALTDLLLPSSPISALDTLLMRIICRMASVPFSNLCPLEPYLSAFREIGFEDVEVQDLTNYVFSGLAKFIEAQSVDAVLREGLHQGKMMQYRGFARVLKWWAGSSEGKEKLKFVMVRARKPLLSP